MGAVLVAGLDVSGTARAIGRSSEARTCATRHNPFVGTSVTVSDGKQLTPVGAWRLSHCIRCGYVEVERYETSSNPFRF